MSAETETDQRKDALRCVQCEFRADDSPGGWYDLSEHRSATGHRYEHVRPAPKPLTVADIPAGQGAASLFLARGEDGHQALLFKTDDGGPVLIMWETMPDPAMDALWEHLAATLPAVTEDAAP